MTEETRPFVRGYETNIITTFRKFKYIVLDLLRGYPAYVYYGKFESVFAENGEKIVDILHKHNIIEILKGKEVKKSKLIKKLPPEEIKELEKQGIVPRFYRLTQKGVELAISLISLEHSERVLRYSEEMRNFTIIVIIAAIGALIFGFVQTIISLWF